MANINDIGKKFGIIYTCNCGWLDHAHSNPWSKRPGMGVANFWDRIVNEKGRDAVLNGNPAYLVGYEQDAVKEVLGMTFHPSVGQQYVVRRGLSTLDKQRVALAIFTEVSLRFEERQNSWLARRTTGTDSGFSEEDLVSNLIGFYRALFPQIEVDRLCKPVSVQASRKIWNDDGPVGENKNKSFTPKFHKCDDCKETPAFPQQFQLIVPASKGFLFNSYRW